MVSDVTRPWHVLFIGERPYCLSRLTPFCAHLLRESGRHLQHADIETKRLILRFGLMAAMCRAYPNVTTVSVDSMLDQMTPDEMAEAGRLLDVLSTPEG
jgi:hypothetical protein